MRAYLVPDGTPYLEAFIRVAARDRRHGGGDRPRRAATLLLRTASDSDPPGMRIAVVVVLVVVVPGVPVAGAVLLGLAALVLVLVAGLARQQAAQSVQGLRGVIETLRRIREELEQSFVERSDVITGALVALPAAPLEDDDAGHDWPACSCASGWRSATQPSSGPCCW